MQPGDIVLKPNAYRPEVGRVVKVSPKTVTVEIGYFQKFNTPDAKPIFRQLSSITERWEKNVIVLDTEPRLNLAQVLLSKMESARQQVKDIQTGARKEAEQFIHWIVGAL